MSWSASSKSIKLNLTTYWPSPLCGCLAVLIYFCCCDISQGESNPGKCPETRVISRMSLSVLAAPMSPCRSTPMSYQHQDTLLQRAWCLWFHHVISHEPQHQQPLFIVSQQTWFLAMVWLEHLLKLLLFNLYQRQWTSMNILILQLTSRGESSSGQARVVEQWRNRSQVLVAPQVRQSLTHIAHQMLRHRF